MTHDPQKDRERRKDDGHAVRIALVERSFFEVKDSLTAVCRRLAEQDDKFDAGVKDIVARIDTHELARALICREQANSLAKIETTQTWLERWEAAAWAAIMALAGIFYHHNSKGH